MASSAVTLAVTVGAEAALVAGNALVALDPVAAVLGVVQPGRRQHLPARKLRSQHAALLAQVAGGAATRSLALLLARVLMARQARAHARQLIGGGKLHVLDLAVAGLTLHAA